MSWFDYLVVEGKNAGTLWYCALVLVNSMVARSMGSRERRIWLAPLVLFGLHLALLPIVAYYVRAGTTGTLQSRVVCMVLGALAGVMAGGSILFTGVLPRLKVGVPRIVRDVLIGAASVIAVLTVATRAGLNLSGVIATSAVLTAVVGLSLQDTLGNIMSGLALQTDESIHIGDWIKVGDVVGQVVEIRWRYTSVETRDWETVIFPNSQLVKGQVIVLGRRRGERTKLRRSVRFNVDYRFAPTEVIAKVTNALRAAPIPNVASKPKPEVLLLDFGDSFGRYAARYWLTDLMWDEGTDSAIRTRVFFALRRAGLPMSIPAHAIFVTEESAERRSTKSQVELTRRTKMLKEMDLFDSLADAELEQLALGLRYAPFAAGETIVRQGDAAEWLYIVAAGELSVRVRGEREQEREVAKLSAGSFFGERSLLTGEPRSASVTALTDAECWRLDKETFRELLERRPEIATEVADVLSNRQAELTRVRDDLGQAASSRAQDRDDLVFRIRRFFRLEGGEPPASRHSTN
jgi:small-conductance mechanosensitive channel/CRP-like cAMP-binding protein